MRLYFQNKYGKEKLIANPKTVKECYEEIDKFLKEHNFTSYYTRINDCKNFIELDVGSYTEFFLVYDISFNDFVNKNTQN